jgi:hypothetical protein
MREPSMRTTDWRGRRQLSLTPSPTLPPYFFSRRKQTLSGVPIQIFQRPKPLAPAICTTAVELQTEGKCGSLERQCEVSSCASPPLYSVWLRAGRPGDRGSIPGRGKRFFLLSSVSGPALGPTQPPVQWVPGVLSPGVKRGWGVTLTTHPHLIPRSWMSRTYIPSPPKRLHGV